MTKAVDGRYRQTKDVVVRYSKQRGEWWRKVPGKHPQSLNETCLYQELFAFEQRGLALTRSLNPDVFDFWEVAS